MNEHYVNTQPDIPLEKAEIEQIYDKADKFHQEVVTTQDGITTLRLRTNASPRSKKSLKSPKISPQSTKQSQ